MDTFAFRFSFGNSRPQKPVHQVSMHFYQKNALAKTPTAPLLAIMEKYDATPAENATYKLAFGDGSEALFEAFELETSDAIPSCFVYYDRLSLPISQFIYEVAQAGRFVMMPVRAGNPYLFLSEDQESHFLKQNYFSSSSGQRIGYAVFVRSVDELHKFLEG